MLIANPDTELNKRISKNVHSSFQIPRKQLNWNGFGIFLKNVLWRSKSSVSESKFMFYMIRFTKYTPYFVCVFCFVCVCLASCLLLTMLLLNNRKRNREKKHTPEHLRPKCAPHAYYMLWKSTVNCLCIIDLSLHSVYTKCKHFAVFFSSTLLKRDISGEQKKNSDNHI